MCWHYLDAAIFQKENDVGNFQPWCITKAEVQVECYQVKIRSLTTRERIYNIGRTPEGPILSAKALVKSGDPSLIHSLDG